MKEITAQRQDRDAYLRRHVQRLADRGIAARSELLDSTGGICGTILAFEQRANIDLTILATHGRSGLTRWSLGSVAERLVQHGRVPVLLVRVQPRDTSTAQAVVPLDGSKAAEAALPAMMDLGASLIQTVVLLQIIDQPQRRAAAMAYLNGVADRLTATGLHCICQVEEGDPAEEILKIGDTSRVIVMTTHGHPEILGRSLGIVAGRVVHRSAAPVLLVRVREDS
jgi:nucleotide-binding universal stress UspA family protein